MNARYASINEHLIKNNNNETNEQIRKKLRAAIKHTFLLIIDESR